MSSLDQVYALAREKAKTHAEASTRLWCLIRERKPIDTIALHEQRIIVAKQARELIDEIGDLCNQLAGFETDNSDVGGGPVLKYHP